MEGGREGGGWDEGLEGRRVDKDGGRGGGGRDPPALVVVVSRLFNPLQSRWRPLDPSDVWHTSEGSDKDDLLTLRGLMGESDLPARPPII